MVRDGRTVSEVVQTVTMWLLGGAAAVFMGVAALRVYRHWSARHADPCAQYGPPGDSYFRDQVDRANHFMTWVLDCGRSGALYEHTFARAQLQVRGLALATFTDSAGRQCRRFHREFSQSGPWTSVDGTACRVGATWTSQDTLR